MLVEELEASVSGKKTGIVIPVTPSYVRARKLLYKPLCSLEKEGNEYYVYVAVYVRFHETFGRCTYRNTIPTQTINTARPESDLHVGICNIPYIPAILGYLLPFKKLTYKFPYTLMASLKPLSVRITVGDSTEPGLKNDGNCGAEGQPPTTVTYSDANDDTDDCDPMNPRKV